MMTPEKDIEDIKEPVKTWRIVKNVMIISLAFMVHFSACNGAINLQSSINAEAGLGTASLATVYAGIIFSNIFLPAMVIKSFGTKWTIALSFIMYMPFIAAQLKPTFYTMIPAALLVGIGGGPLWCAKCTYLYVASEAHSKISKVATEALLVRFLGLFFMIFQMGQVCGNLVSFLVISSGNNEAALTLANASLVPELCGAKFLPATDAGEVLQQQPLEKIQIITGVYLACMVGAVLIVAVGLDSMKRYESGRKSECALSGLALLSVTVKLLMEPNQRLMVVICIFIGMEQAFFSADFTVAFVSCVIGTGSVGFVMMFYGVANAISCVITGYLAKLIGRFSLICAAAIVHGALFITILAWRPEASSSYLLYIIAVLWGFCDSVWSVVVKAYNGTLFPGREEASFSNYSLWESVGYVIAYSLSSYLRTSAKTYLMMAMMVVGVTGYFIVEFRDRRTKKLVVSKEICSAWGCDNIAFQNID